MSTKIPKFSWWTVSGTTPNTCITRRLQELHLSDVEILVLNGYIDGYPELVAQIRENVPGIKILMYRHLQRQEPGVANLGDLVIASWYPTCVANAQDWGLLQSANGLPFRFGDTYFMDITNSEFRAASIAHFVDRVEWAGVDGVAIDAHFTRLEDYDVPSEFVNGTAISAAWPAAAKQVLVDMKTALGPDKLVLYNGIWAHVYDERPRNQGAILDDPSNVDMALNEHWSSGPDNFNFDTFRKFVRLIGEELDRHADRKMFVRGNYPGEYTSYLDDLRNARYAFGCHLLVRPINCDHKWLFNQHLQVQRLPDHRSNGLARYDFQELLIGEPLNRAFLAAGGWIRDFANGWVFVNPRDGDDAGVPRTFVVQRPGFLSSGLAVTAGQKLLVQPGDAVLCCDTALTVPSTMSADLTETESENFLLQIAASEYRYTTLSLEFRSTNLAACVLVRGDTDDNPRPFYRLELIPVGGTANPLNLDYPYAQNGHSTATELDGPSYQADGNWQIKTVNLVNPNLDFPIHTVRSVRSFGGSVEFRKIELSDPVLIVDPSRPVPQNNPLQRWWMRAGTNPRSPRSTAQLIGDTDPGSISYSKPNDLAVYTAERNYED